MDVGYRGVLVLAHKVNRVDDLGKLATVDHVVGLQLGTVDHEGDESGAFDGLDDGSGIDGRGEDELGDHRGTAGVDEGEVGVAASTGTGLGDGGVAAVGALDPHLDERLAHPRLEGNLLGVDRVGGCAGSIDIGAGGVKVGVAQMPVPAVASGDGDRVEFEGVGAVLADDYGGVDHLTVAREGDVGHVDVDFERECGGFLVDFHVNVVDLHRLHRRLTGSACAEGRGKQQCGDECGFLVHKASVSMVRRCRQG